MSYAPAMVDLHKCPQCGATNPIDAEWCGQCFSAFEVKRPEDEEPPPQPEPSAKAPLRRGWECRLCGHENDVELSSCEACGAAIFDSYGARESDRERDPEAALRRSFIFPGFGYGPLGHGAIGVIAGFLATASLVVGVMLLAAGELLGLFLLALFLMIWAVSVVDVIRLAQGEKEPLLRPRVLSIAGGLVVALLFLSVLVAFQAATS